MTCVTVTATDKPH